jgi:hypothetical protein
MVEGIDMTNGDKEVRVEGIEMTKGTKEVKRKEAGDVKMNSWWVQTLMTIGTILVGISIAWGAYSSKIEVLEKDVDKLQGDHDLLISLKVKIESISDGVNEMKCDLKDIKKVIYGKTP